MNKLGSDFISTIGNTPLLRLDRLFKEFTGITVLAKAEWSNPGGSVKDRAAARMITEGERAGLLTRDKIILDATSGNTGIAYACIAAARGYKLMLCVPGNISPERKQILAALGAQVVYTSPQDGSDGAIIKAREIYRQSPDKYFYPDQYSNDANWQAHYHSTGPEIIKQTEGQVDVFVATVGTGGTLIGTGKYLREFNPSIKIIAVEPDSPFHGLEGMKYMRTSIKPDFYDLDFADETLYIPTETAHESILRVAKQEGILIGLSSGAAVEAVRRTAEQMLRRGQTGTIVTVFPDNADKYFSERFWSNKED